MCVKIIPHINEHIHHTKATVVVYLHFHLEKIFCLFYMDILPSLYIFCLSYMDILNSLYTFCLSYMDILNSLYRFHLFYMDILPSLYIFYSTWTFCLVFTYSVYSTWTFCLVFTLICTEWRSLAPDVILWGTTLPTIITIRVVIFYLTKYDHQ